MFALPDQELAEHEVSWLAIRQPAVIRLLERELASPDGDAFAAGLELACRVLGAPTSLGDMRLDHNSLNSGMVAVRSGRCDRAMVRSIVGGCPDHWWKPTAPRTAACTCDRF